MLEFSEALESVLQHALPLPAGELTVGDCLGLVLAEEVASDIDSPPFDKSIVDGYAVVAADLASGTAVLEVQEEVTAGDVPRQAVSSGRCTRIMTGAPVPPGADAVVMIERSTDSKSQTSNPKSQIRLEDTPRPGQNIMRQGQSMRRGETVLSAGRVVGPAEVGLLCEVGRERARVVPRPRVAVLPTGNEIIPAGRTPRGGQIRNTNGPMLAAAVARAGGVPVDLGVARDDPDELRGLIRQGLECDVLLLSGGVSAGVLDLVPAALAAEGVEQVFHKVRFKPGKPLWFGTAKGTLVFGLPGNPVSSLVTFELFVRPALARLAGRAEESRRTAARLAMAFTHRGDRPTYHPATLRDTPGGPEVQPLPWQGSADLKGMSLANALVRFPAGNREHAVGELLEVYRL